MVIDTNILLHQYEAIRTFVEDVEKAQVPVLIVVPGAVIYEIDGLKKQTSLAWPARRASGWLLEKVREHRAVKVQATEETCKPSRNWRSRTEASDLSIPKEMMNDHLIVDCCQFFQRKHPRTIMCSADHNLCIMAQSQGIPTMTPPPKKTWTSRDIAIVLYGPNFPLLAKFEAENKAFTRRDARQPVGTPAPAIASSEDVMMVDEEEVIEEAPLNVLHDDVRVYFTRLLLEAAVRIGGTDLTQQSCDTGLSRHAAGWRKIHYSSWTATECLEYLSYMRPEVDRAARNGHPRLEAFLGRRYTTQGARTGREWSPQDWRSALKKLGNIGGCLGDDDPGLIQAVEDLGPYLDQLFVNL
ncbi:PIN domain-containing protein [Coprinopsis sp. MPI-PUGE-AT-0042]|nr:PIN domain-containing protein [Coprinopsis sp. MPI-PUGE-AT-0042]